MAILDSSPKTGRCPECGSRDVKIEFKKIYSNKVSTITKKWIKCNNCRYER